MDERVQTIREALELAASLPFGVPEAHFAQLQRLDELTIGGAALAALAEIERENERLREALGRILANAEDWHGPPQDRGQDRALTVIAEWSRAALAVEAGEEARP